jgi:hypothetical protein
MKKRCYLCGDTEGQRDVFHHNRCLKCKREQSRRYSIECRQKILEVKFLKGEKGISFCGCGDYFKTVREKYSMCWNCRRKR